MKFKSFIRTLPVSIFSIILSSCGGEVAENQTNQESVLEDGLALMEKNCYSCHNTQGTDNMLAPPMQRVKDHYKNDETTKNDFVKAIVDWCKNPTEEKSQMPGARNKFGLMPKQEFDEKEVEIIAAYLFENDLDQSCSH